MKLRLRRPNRDWDFFPFDQILDTMLHELCHNVHSPHNAEFYKLWDEIRKVGFFFYFTACFKEQKLHSLYTQTACTNAQTISIYVGTIELLELHKVYYKVYLCPILEYSGFMSFSIIA